MFAWIGVVLFALSLLVQWLDVSTNNIVNSSTLNTAGLLFVALSLAGWAPRAAWRGRRR
ncbi:hypothetical protein HDA40_001027 [Hamadaea flava]|uniref:Uncharacterized protein n=1 Tax=Hamadaea flava TaxID=1742688 RepID=A0ABV8LPC6_9ACTN|nr:hypothetical protein [Hamadaea flava]MCP2322520.1 hypothetical protein [Hamadaea flava]